MSEFCGVIVALALAGLPISAIWLLIRIIRKKKLKPAIISITTCLGVVLVFTIIGVATWNPPVEHQEYSEKQTQKEIEENEKDALAKEEEQLELDEKQIEEENKEHEKTEDEPTTVPIVETTKEPTETLTVIPTEVSAIETQTETKNVVTQYPTITEKINNSEELESENEEETEEGYKEKCKQIYYEDIKDKSGVSIGKYAKIEVYLQQQLQYDAYKASTDDLWKDNNLDLTFFEFGALSREFEDNYGGENLLLFSNDYALTPYDYECVSKYIVYGNIIDVKTNGWTGKSIIYIVPKYIDNIE